MSLSVGYFRSRHQGTAKHDAETWGGYKQWICHSEPAGQTSGVGLSKDHLRGCELTELRCCNSVGIAAKVEGQQRLRLGMA
jgi:hypothetical protein